MNDFQNQTSDEGFDSATEATPAGDDGMETGFEMPAEHSPQRSALMLLALIVLVGGGGIYLMHKKAGPSQAQASAENTQANTDISEFLNDGGKNINRMKDMLRDTEKVVQGFLQHPATAQVKLEELKTNPFEMEKPKVVKPAEDPAEKARQAAAEKARLAAIEKEKQDIRTAASKLQLQSILYSENRGTCLIGGRTYTQGNKVDGFTVEQIDRTSVIVRKGDYRFKLTMQQPE